MTEFFFQKMFEMGEDQTEYRQLPGDFLRLERCGSREILQVRGEALAELTAQAFHDVSHYLRASHLAKLAHICADGEASDNDRFVAMDLLRNAVIAAEGIWPSCQDTGTALVMGKKGEQVWVEGEDEEWISRGVYDTWARHNLRYSQVAPLTMWQEANTGSNLPAQIELQAVKGSAYSFLFVAKGGGSANKTFLYQKTKALLNRSSMANFLGEVLLKVGTAACPPYHLAVAVGGTSAEATLKTVKLASCGYLDHLPRQGNAHGRAFRDVELEKEIEELARRSGIGAQFGGKYFVHDVRVIRLPRHGASCPVGVGVSCSADRQARGYISRDGVFLEQLERHPARFLPSAGTSLGEVTRIDLRRPMGEILRALSAHPVSTRLMLDGPMIVARDIAHARLKEMAERGETLPEYFRNHPVYYAGPAKTPQGEASGSFGPTTSERMDPYVDLFQSRGGSMVMVGKGNRAAEVRQACQRWGGFYLGSIGGPAARLGKECIRKVEVLDFADLGMEAVWRIEVQDFPAFLITDDKGNDFYQHLGLGV